jgi:type IV pilus assembly protein PilA
MSQPDLHRSRGTDLASGRNAYGVTAQTNGSQGGTMLQNIRRRVAARLAGEESGFTLIELLVVMLILGILAAIALPAFFNQKDKAGDAKAKEYAHSAQVAMETYSTDHDGSYVGATDSKLEAIEPTLENVEGGTIISGTPAAKEYEVTIQSSTEGQSFSIKNEEGKLSYPCEEEGTGGCPEGGDWGGS